MERKQVKSVNIPNWRVAIHFICKLFAKRNRGVKVITAEKINPASGRAKN